MTAIAIISLLVVLVMVFHLHRTAHRLTRLERAVASEPHQLMSPDEDSLGADISALGPPTKGDLMISMQSMSLGELVSLHHIAGNVVKRRRDREG